jgi:ribokinase
MPAAMAPAIVVVGSSNTDLVVRVPQVPRPGETVLGGDLRTLAGGKGANQAVAARRVGADVTFVGCLGDDRFGDEAAATLACEGLRLDYLRRVLGAPSGVALIAVAANGQNSIIVAPGANARLGPEDIERAGPALRAARIVIAQLEVPLVAVQRAFALARAAGATTLLNPAPAQPLDDELLGLVDVIVCNETEAELLTGMAVADAAGAEVAAQALLNRGPRLAIVTRGEAGSTLAEVDGIAHVPAFTVPVVDTTAAGDAFIGAFACRLAAGAAPVDAARYAAAAAALSVGKEGAQPSLPAAAAVDALLAAHDAGRL